jgi:hypothetical protein
MAVRRAISITSWALIALLVGFSGRPAQGQVQPQSAQPLQGSPLPAPQAQVSARDEGEDEPEPGRSPRDDFQVGPLVGIGFPRPLALGGIVKVQRLVSLGVEYSFLPETTISDVNTSFWAIAGDMRLFPFRNFFFVGLRAGRQHLAADTVIVYGEQRYAVAAAVKTVFINPRLGLLFTWSSGITLGLDAGLQIPVSARESGALAAADAYTVPQGMEIIQEVRSVADYLGHSTIPTFDLLRVGLLL